MLISSLANIWRLGVKELWSLWRDPVMLILIIYTFTASVYTAASAMPDTLHNAPIAMVDEDQSQLSARITSAFYPPQFVKPRMLTQQQVDAAMDAGEITFALTIPTGFQRDVLSGKSVALQLNVDATRMSQAFSGSGYVQQIVAAEVSEFAQRHRATTTLPVGIELRASPCSGSAQCVVPRSMPMQNSASGLEVVVVVVVVMLSLTVPPRLAPRFRPLFRR